MEETPLSIDVLEMQTSHQHHHKHSTLSSLKYQKDLGDSRGMVQRRQSVLHHLKARNHQKDVEKLQTDIQQCGVGDAETGKGVERPRPWWGWRRR